MSKFEEALENISDRSDWLEENITIVTKALTQAAEIERGDKVVVDGWKPIATLPVDAGHVKLWYEYKDRSGTVTSE